MSDTQNEIEEFIIETLGDRFGIPGAKLSSSADLKALGIDSLGGVELGLVLKKRYGVRFVAGEIRVEFTVAEIAALAEDKLTEIKAVAP